MFRSSQFFIGLVTTALLGSGLAAAKMNVSVASLTVDGQEVRDLSCELDSGGLFASVAIVGTLAKQKKAFDACAPEGAAFSVELTFVEGGAKNAKVLASSTKGKDDCVTRALSHLRAGVAGKCTAVILTGKSAAAKKAAESLVPPVTPAGK